MSRWMSLFVVFFAVSASAQEAKAPASESPAEPAAAADEKSEAEPSEESPKEAVESEPKEKPAPQQTEVDLERLKSQLKLELLEQVFATTCWGKGSPALYIDIR